MELLKNILSIPPEKLGVGTGVPVTIVRDDNELSNHFARSMVDEIRRNNELRRPTNFILPVGPKGQYGEFVSLIVTEKIDIGRLSLFFMDEYLDDDNNYIPIDHPLSFRGFIRDALILPLKEKMGFDPGRACFPDPKKSLEYSELVKKSGGIDITFAGVGINGHIAFNEPPEPGIDMSVEAFKELPTRVITLSRETRTINSVTSVGGAIDIIPKRAVTIGMRELLEARRIMVYMNRPWNRAVVRKMLYGDISPAFPASLIRGHQDARVMLTEDASKLPIPARNRDYV